MKSRGVYETPGGTVLLAAHRAIESITLDRGAAHLKDELMPRYAELIYNGLWFSPEREMLQALIDRSQAHVTGLVRLKLYKGNVQVVGRQAPHSLYDNALATFEADTVYDQRDAEGFIKLNALRLRVLARARPATTCGRRRRASSNGGAAAVDFLYGLGSRYSYLASTQIARLETETGCRVRWRPLFSGDLFAARGRDPFAGAPASGQYDWAYRRRDAERWAAYYGVPYREPDDVQFDPRRLALACAAAPRLGAVEAFSRLLFGALFVDGVSPLDDDVCVGLAGDAGLDPAGFRQAIEPARDRGGSGGDGRGSGRARRLRRAELRARRRRLLRQRPAGAVAPRPAQDARDLGGVAGPQNGRADHEWLASRTAVVVGPA